MMKKITSFTIDHIKLVPGVYVSRKDTVGVETITTFDIRMTSPNDEPVMNTAEMHTIEHLAATFLRNHKEFGPKIIYFGPMGCRTGFYLLLAGDYDSKDIIDLLKEMFVFIADFEGEVPGASAKDCGNYLDMNLPMAKYLAKKYLDEVLEDISFERLISPEEIPSKKRVNGTHHLHVFLSLMQYFFLHIRKGLFFAFFSQHLQHELQEFSCVLMHHRNFFSSFIICKRTTIGIVSVHIYFTGCNTVHQHLNNVFFRHAHARRSLIRREPIIPPILQMMLISSFVMEPRG